MVKELELFSDCILYVILKGHWYVTLSVHAPVEDQEGGTKFNLGRHRHKCLDDIKFP